MNTHTPGGWPGGDRKPGIYQLAGNPPLTDLDLGRAVRMLAKPTDEHPQRLCVHPATQVQAEKACRRVCYDLNAPLALRLTTDIGPGEWVLTDGRVTLWSSGIGPIEPSTRH